MLTEQDIRDALSVCYDPEIPLNIVELGLVETIELHLDPDAPGAGIPGVPARFRLSVTLTPASPDEDARSQLRAQVENRLAGLPQLSATSVRLVDEPLWTPARISLRGRRSLGLDQPHFPILNNRLR